MNFSNFFNNNNCIQKINAIIHDQNLVEFGANIYEHVWANVENNDSEIYLFLTESGAEAYQKMNGEEKSQVEQLLHDWMKERYDYIPGEN